VPYAVGAYIVAAYWFTASTSFANPAVTIARSLTNTFSGIRPVDVPGFIVAQIAGAVAAAVMSRAMSFKPRVLILCTGNSARSQMAEGLLRHDAGDRFEVASAGTAPTRVRPEAILAMKELGIDISGHRSKSVDEFAGEKFDFVLTVCDHANEVCPVYPGHTNRLHRSFEDPAAIDGADAQRLDAFRRVRDEIRSYLRDFPK
jgi:arsenate reductase